MKSFGFGFVVSIALSAAAPAFAGLPPGGSVKVLPSGAPNQKPRAPSKDEARTEKTPTKQYTSSKKPVTPSKEDARQKVPTKEDDAVKKPATPSKEDLRAEKIPTKQDTSVKKPAAPSKDDRHAEKAPANDGAIQKPASPSVPAKEVAARRKAPVATKTAGPQKKL